MAKINLLPWREWERERKKNEFLTQLAIVAVFGLVLVMGAGTYLDGLVDNQQARNRFVQTRISVMDKRIAEISKLREEREDLLARMRVIQELQGNRPIIVHVFDDLVRTLAKGVYYDKVSLTGTGLSMNGIAESNNRISSLMRNIESSDWFARPNLKGIKENTSQGAQASSFEMTASQVNPKQSAEENL
ncbi:MAG: PilN domain-containing protein [Pseudomonadales bacterium]|nr:PilN domain-containing protein [Pseudomonadales bacterium]